MNDRADSLGEQGVHVLPSNQSTLFADSRLRENPNSSVMNFKMNCDRIRMKEFYYNSLYWKQSIYTHNNTSVELRYQFQTNGVTSPIYVAYAMPFVIYTSFDGNSKGSVFATPNPNVVSYARQMEYALNQDYRLESFNAVRKFNNYRLDGWGPVNGINVYFRYNSSGCGFALWALPVDPIDNVTVFPVSVKILQCDWVQYGYNVHGFGFPYAQYQPANASSNPTNIQTPTYGPNPNFVSVYYAESQAMLLPFRYIVIQSPELTKDRRIPSFHSGNVSRFNNEIAVFALLLKNANIWHVDRTNDDSTVVSIRENYAPESATFIITNEAGVPLTTSQILSTCLNSTYIPITDRLAMLVNGTSYGGCRLSPEGMNVLLFNVNGGSGTFPVILNNNLFGDATASAMPDDVCHELTVIIKDN